MLLLGPVSRDLSMACQNYTEFRRNLAAADICWLGLLRK